MRGFHPPLKIKLKVFFTCRSVQTTQEISKMVCSICKEGGHNASSCSGQIVTEWTEKVKRFWLYGHNNSVENDEAVKEWARTARFKMPLVNRIWSNLCLLYTSPSPRD